MKKRVNSCVSCEKDRCTILKNCQYEFLELLDEQKYCLTYMKGQQIIHEGSEVEGIYIVSAGVVKVHIKGYRKRPFILYLAKAGNILGHETDENHKNLVSATAVEETHICFIEQKDFDLVLQKNAGVREDLQKEFNRDLLKIQLRAVRLAQMNVREKMADILLHIAEVYQIDNSTDPFEIHLSREEIGDLIGVTKEQVSKKFSELKEEKVINASAKHMQILNYKKLKEIAGI